MKKTLSLLALSLVTFIILFASSCKKEAKKPSDANAAKDNSTADNAFAGIWRQIGKVANDSSYIRLTGYPIITITPFNATTYPKTVTIDYGTTNVLSPDDFVNRRGVLKAVFTGPYTDSGTVITITPTNYYHNNYKIQGVQTIRNKGTAANGHITYNVVVNGAIITNTSGKNASWTTNQDREWIQGYDTPFTFGDDIYKIRGTASGSAFSGDAYQVTTNYDLQINVGCPYIVAGRFTLIMNEFPDYPIVFDYGAGACDASATATLNGTVYNIVLN
jgi:hypothetical protein